MAKAARKVKVYDKSLAGTWTFRQLKPLSFKFVKKGVGLQLKLDNRTMSEEAWRSLFRFLIFNFTHLRAHVPLWVREHHRLMLRKRARARRKRKYSRRRKAALLMIANPVAPKSLVKPREDDSTTGPSADLQSVAEAALKAKS